MSLSMNYLYIVLKMICILFLLFSFMEIDRENHYVFQKASLSVSIYLFLELGNLYFPDVLNLPRYVINNNLRASLMLLLFFLLEIMVLSISFRGSQQKKFVIGTMIIGMKMIAEFCVYANFRYWYTQETETVARTTFLAVSPFCDLILLFLTAILLKVAINDRQREFRPHYNFFLALLIFANEISFLIQAYYAPFNWWVLISGSTMAIGSIGVVLFINYLYDVLQKEAQNRIIKKQVEYQQVLLQTSQGHLEKTRSLIHDYNKHLIVLKGAAEANDRELALSYINQVFEDTNDQGGSLVYSGNRVIDAMFHHLVTQCNNKGIQITHTFQLTRSLQMDELDLAVALGNLFDNAYENCTSENQSGWINVEIRNKQNQLLIIISNSQGESKKELKDWQQQTQTARGTGLVNVRSCLSKYNGLIEINQSSASYQTKIIIPQIK